MRSRPLTIAGWSLGFLAAASLAALFLFEPAPAPPPPEPAPIPPEVAAAVAAGRKAATAQAQPPARPVEPRQRLAEAAPPPPSRDGQPASEPAETGARRAGEAGSGAGAETATAPEAAAGHAGSGSGLGAAHASGSGSGHGAGTTGSSPPAAYPPALAPRMEELRGRLAHCSTPPAAQAEAGVQPRFRLELVPSGEAYRVRAATVESAGGASDAALSCMQAALSGIILPTPGTSNTDDLVLTFSP